MEPHTMQEVAAGFRDVMHLIQERVKPIIQSSGLGLTHLGVLRFLMLNGPSTHAEVSAAMGLTAGAFTPVVKQLEAKGFVWREKDPEDGRRILVGVTPEALTRGQELFAEGLARVSDLFEGLSEEDGHVLLSLLDRIRRAGGATGSGRVPGHGIIAPDD